MNETRMIYRPDKYAVSFEWQGGSYIDVFSMETGHSSEPMPNDSEGVYQRASAKGAPFHAIGVWDYGTGKPSIPVTRDAFERECDEWLSDADNRRDYGITEK